MQRGYLGRLSLLFPLCLVCAPLAASTGASDPFFASVPFSQWQSQGKRHQIRWDVEFFPVELSVHQRLLSRVRIEVDHDPAVEPVPRPLAVLIEYRNPQGKIWQTHALDRKPARTSVFFGNAFVLPGAYQISIAVVDPDTLEHSFVSHTIHVKPLAGDPLPLAWRDLPDVELLPPNADPPDEWFLPTVTSTLNLPVATRRPVHLDVFVNATPGGNSAGSAGALRRNMSVLVPALKVISQVKLRSGEITVHMVDLGRRRVTFRQDHVDALDWPRLRDSFTENRPGIVDVAALAGFWNMRNFFWEQVALPRPEADPPARAVIVLSGPAFFPGQEQFPGRERLSVAAEALYYIRYRPPDFGFRRMRPRPGSRPLPSRALVLPMPDDDLEQAARKLDARVFDVISASDFRRVLAIILGQIAEL